MKKCCQSGQPKTKVRSVINWILWGLVGSIILITAINEFINF